MDFESDYLVEDYIKPKKIRRPLVNDESADLLGNFDDKKRKEIQTNSFIKSIEEDPFASEDDDSDDTSSKDGDEEDVEAAEDEVPQDQNGSDAVGDDSEVAEAKQVKKKKKKKDKTTEEQPPTAEERLNASGKLSGQQVTALMKGASKQNRFVLYVTNLNYNTPRERLHEFFQQVGDVKSVRIPKNRKTAFAFVEMENVEGYKDALGLHNHSLDDYKIKIQVSEGGKKKSANKKNIIKQKNRKLAEMRHEGKQFSRSGKGYDKTIKKEIRQKQMQQERRLAKKQLKKSNKSTQ